MGENIIMEKKESQNQKIYDLELHESIWIDAIDADVIRVEGGWIYKYYKSEYKEASNRCVDYAAQIVFIPYNDEFKNL